MLLLMVFAAALMIGGTAHADSFFGWGRGEEGSGDIVSEERDMDDFDRILLKGSTDVEVTVGTEHSVTVIADDNLQDNIQTRVRRNGRLEIRTKDSYDSDYRVKVVITMPSLTEFSISGSADAVIIGLDEDELELRIDGSGEIEAEGRVDVLAIEINGSGDIDARDLHAEDVEVSISGSGDVEVYATGVFYGRISGSGDIDLYGDPDKYSSHIGGSGDINVHD